MPFSCIYPGCGLKCKSFHKESFHELPYRYNDLELLQQWMVVLNMDLTTPVEMLKKKHYRVCSRHFDKDDFVHPRTVKEANRRRRVKVQLKRNAIPRARVGPPATDTVETGDQQPAQAITEGSDKLHIQSTPIKSQDTSESRLAALTFSLTSPESSDARPRTRRSLSGMYVARTPTWKLAEDMGATASCTPLHGDPLVGLFPEDMGATSATCTPLHGAAVVIPEEEEDLLQDMSTSFGEWQLDDPTDDPNDDSFKLPSDPSPSSPSGSASTSSYGSNNAWSERKWIVDESCIMQMFQTCCQCGMPMEEKKLTKYGSQLKIRWTCLQGHKGLWQSCPDQRKMAQNNILTSAAILFSGATYTDIKDWSSLLNIQLPAKTQFYAVQSKYLVPVINNAYRNQQSRIIERLKDNADTAEKVALAGDARCDSPGFSAKYSTYSFMNDATQEIVHFELVQVTEASSSVAMEVMAFQRGLDHLLTKGVDVGVVTTDRSPSIRKIMRETYSDIRHEFDVWHVNKSVKKKLVTASNKKENQDLQTWLKSISNHLYWSCSSSHGDGEECVRRWKSLLHHIVGIHRWEEDGIQHTCHHAPLTDDEQCRKRWMKVDSPAYRALKSIVLDNHLLRDLKQMALFKHTGSLEVFHSSMLKYTQKRLHFSYDSMLARIQLAVMDHNANIKKEQAKTKEGQPRFACAYSKASRQWTTRPVYERGEQSFRKDLMEDTLKMRDKSSIEDWPRPAPHRKKLLKNIAPVPRPDKSELIRKSTSRFKPL